MPDSNKLSKRHPFYESFQGYWDFWISMYEGINSVLDSVTNSSSLSSNQFNVDNLAVFEQNERESDSNYAQRIKEAYSFDYSKSIINIYNFYLFEKEPQRNLEALANDELFQSFVDDCDLYGANFNTWIIQAAKYASIYGTVGIMVDSPNIQTFSRAEQIAQNIYPFVTLYHPQQILYWRYDINRYTRRPYLAELLLQDGEHYRYWTTEVWEVWGANEDNDSKSELTLLETGQNQLKEIPFLWMENNRGRYRNMGVSDIAGISRIDLSIINNLSQAEEIMKYTGFPMMRKPMELAGTTKKEDLVSATAVLEFDPENPSAKPDWLEPSTKSAIDAILTWIQRKEEAIYQTANIGGLSATQQSASAKSGEARKWEFRMLNSNLAMKAEQIEEAEYMIIWYWLKWQGQENLYNDIKINYPRDFNIEQLEQDLMNIMTAKQLVRSETFKREIEKQAARMTLPKLAEEMQQVVDDEIDSTTPTQPTVPEII